MSYTENSMCACVHMCVFDCVVFLGECAVGHLQVAPDCPGEDGHRYSVTFSLDDETARRTNVDIPPFEFSFIFCNGTMAVLSPVCVCVCNYVEAVVLYYCVDNTATPSHCCTHV